MNRISSHAKHYGESRFFHHIEIDSLQMIGTAQGSDAMDAYRNLLSENPHLQGKKFERFFCYQADPYDGLSMEE